MPGLLRPGRGHLPRDRADPGAVGPRQPARRPAVRAAGPRAGPGRRARSGPADPGHVRDPRARCRRAADGHRRGGAARPQRRAGGGHVGARGQALVRARAWRIRTTEPMDFDAGDPRAGGRSRAGRGREVDVLPDRPRRGLPHRHGDPVRLRRVHRARPGAGLDADARAAGGGGGARAAAPGAGRRRLGQRRQLAAGLPRVDVHQRGRVGHPAPAAATANGWAWRPPPTRRPTASGCPTPCCATSAGCSAG